MHLAHAVAVGDSVLVGHDHGSPYHQIDCVELGHELLSRQPVLLEDLGKPCLVGVEHEMVLPRPPYVVSELLPLVHGSQCKGVLIEEDLEGVGERLLDARLLVLVVSHAHHCLEELEAEAA